MIKWETYIATQTKSLLVLPSPGISDPLHLNSEQASNELGGRSRTDENLKSCASSRQEWKDGTGHGRGKESAAGSNVYDRLSLWGGRGEGRKWGYALAERVFL